MSVTRRTFLSTALMACGTAAAAEAPLTALRPKPRPNGIVPALARPGSPPIRPSVEDLIKQAGIGDGVHIALIDGADGASLLTRQADTAMMPASTTKSLTAIYGLAHLGAGYRFVTRVLTTGPVVDGQVQGDLILAGGGDPVLDADALADMATELSAKGVRGITGQFYVWAGALPYEAEIEPGQQDHLGYNPSISGLNLNFNRVHFEWRRAGSGYDVVLDARTDTRRPRVDLAKVQVVDRVAPVFATTAPDQWSVARGALGSGGSRWLPVRQPALYAGEVFQVLCGALGLALPAAQKIGALPDAQEVLRHDSPPLDQILRGMLEHSTNLTAEAVGLMASASQGEMPRDLDASAARMGAWLKTRFGVDTHFIDHSGLSDENRISPAAMVQALAGARAELAPLLKQIEIRDAPAYPGQVHAKTGTLNFVSTLAGYVRTASGRDLVFAIMSADLERRAAGIASGKEPPEGALAWNERAKGLQDAVLRRWNLIS